jgi:hypothetical protein
MGRVSKLASIAAATAIVLAPAAAAASPAAPAPAPNAWLTLSQLNPAGATALAGSATAPSVALAGTAATTAQPADEAAYRPNPFPWPVAVVLLGVVATAIYIAFIEKHHGHFTVPTPNSPA